MQNIRIVKPPTDFPTLPPRPQQPSQNQQASQQQTPNQHYQPSYQQGSPYQQQAPASSQGISYSQQPAQSPYLQPQNSPYTQQGLLAQHLPGSPNLPQTSSYSQNSLPGHSSPLLQQSSLNNGPPTPQRPSISQQYGSNQGIYNSDNQGSELARERAERIRLENLLSEYPSKMFQLESMLESERRKSQKLESLDSSSAAGKMHLENQAVISQKNAENFNLTELLKAKDAEIVRLAANNESLLNSNINLKSQLSELEKNLNKVSANFNLERAQLISSIQAQVKDQVDAKIKQYLDENQIVDLSQHFKVMQVNNTGSPPAPLPVPRNVDPTKWSYFVSMDPYQTGKLDAGQMHTTLSKNGSWPHLSLKAVRLAMRAFDRDGDFLNYEQFESCFLYLLTLKAVFEKYDSSRVNEYSWGFIPSDKIGQAISEIGINLKPKTFSLYLARNNPQSIYL